MPSPLPETLHESFGHHLLVDLPHSIAKFPERGVALG